VPAEPLAVHPLSFLLQTRGWGKAEFARLMQDHGRKLGIPLGVRIRLLTCWVSRMSRLVRRDGPAGSRSGR
jgi:hypothetical protein